MSVEARYLLPSDTSIYPLRISQGNNGPWSHFQHERVDLRYAVDFALPLGTEVRAMRRGIILGVLLGGTWYYEGDDPKIGNNPPYGGWTNHLLITHEDSTVALYAHLANETLVRRNQAVEAGDIIAKTGKSGWIGDIPHVHVQVMEGYLKKSLPFTFEDYSGSLDHQTLAREGNIWLGEKS